MQAGDAQMSFYKRSSDPESAKYILSLSRSFSLPLSLYLSFPLSIYLSVSCKKLLKKTRKISCSVQ